MNSERIRSSISQRQIKKINRFAYDLRKRKLETATQKKNRNHEGMIRRLVSRFFILTILPIVKKKARQMPCLNNQEICMKDLYY